MLLNLLFVFVAFNQVFGNNAELKPLFDILKKWNPTTAELNQAIQLIDDMSVDQLNQKV